MGATAMMDKMRADTAANTGRTVGSHRPPVHRAVRIQDARLRRRLGARRAHQDRPRLVQHQDLLRHRDPHRHYVNTMEDVSSLPGVKYMESLTSAIARASTSAK